MKEILLNRCRSKLFEVARRGKQISYGDLAKHVGVINQGLGPYLDAIYLEEIRQDHPDVTLVAVYSGTKFGRYNSRGRAPKSIKVDPENPTDIANYNAELKRVYKHWK
jgi:hypothetical protein